MKKKITNIIKYTLFTVLGILLFWLVYRDQDFENIWYTLRNEVDYRWVVLSVFLGLLSHYSRSLRWIIAMEPLGYKPKKSNAFIAVMLSYFMNLLLPRMGEVARCVVLSKYEKLPFPKLLGTVVSERVVDVIMLLLISMVVFIVDFDRFLAFANQNPTVFLKIKSLLTSPLLWGALVILVLAVVLYFKYSKRAKAKNKLQQLLQGFTDGIKSVLAMKRYKAYIAHSVFIWTLYYLMLYSVFFSFDFTSNLGPVAALTTFVFSSFAMLAPVQGGIGAWHFMAESALSLYGVVSANGKIFALLAHSITQLVIIFAGLVSFVVLPIINRNYLPEVKSEE